MLELYRETVFELRPTPSKRVDIQVPRANGSYDRSKFSKKPERGDKLATDEKSFAAQYLASSSSVYFHHTHAYPRSYLWRIVGNDKLLEISTLDFAREEDTPEADLLLAFEFQDKIASGGVTICDFGKNNDFYVFVLTQENEVFEIRLESHFFQQRSSIPSNTTSWCSAIPASSLSIDKAFRVHADNPLDVFVSFTSGKIQHWKRLGIDQPWTHVNYDDRTWGASLFSIVSRKGHPDIIYNDLRLAHNTAHALVRSGQYLFTICLNHTLRVWHLNSGKLVDSRDLLDQARDPHDNLQLNPAEPGYVQFLDGSNKKEQILLTYSSLNGGQIKLWRITNSASDEPDLFSIEDMVPDSTLSLPDPDPTGTNIWSLAGLRVIFERHTKDWQIWVLWRNHNYHQAYTLNFSLADISNQWRADWVAVSNPVIKAKAPDHETADAKAVTSKWLRHFLFPGRYSRATLETALAQYSIIVDTRLSANDRSKSLQDRLAAVIASQVKLRKFDESTMDHDRFAKDTDQQWRQLWRILESLNEGRYAPLALGVDDQSESTVFAMADMCCMLRECNNLEVLQTRQPDDLKSLQRITRSRWPYRDLPTNMKEASMVSSFLSASTKFFTSFSPELTSAFLQQLEEDLYNEPEAPAASRIVAIYNDANFADAILPNTEKELIRDLSAIGGIDAVSDEIFDAIIKAVSDYKFRPHKTRYTKSATGVQVILAAILEETMALRQLLLSMLAFLIFVDETEKFDTAKHFEIVVYHLRIQERNLWLATNYRTLNQAGGGGEHTLSIMQAMYAQLLRPDPSVNHPMPYLLTKHTRDNIEWISTQNNLTSSDGISVGIQCNLLKHGETPLAMDFLKFQPTTSWSTYVKGRLNLILGECTEAKVCFEDAADGMSSGKVVGEMQEASSGLLSADEAACFYSGKPLYLQHVMALFETQEAYKEAAELAQTILKALESVKTEPRPNFKQSILHRLFKAQLKCSEFDEAYNALAQSSDPLLQKLSATELIDTMLSPNSTIGNGAAVVKKIQNMPLISHPYLSAHVDQHLATLASKQTSIPSADGVWLSSTSVDYLSILHALRLYKKDYRGAVAVLFDRLRIIQKSGRARSDPQAVALRHALLALINTMTCVHESEAYMIVESKDDPRIGGTGLKRARGYDLSNHGPTRMRKRVVVTLDDLRREYQQVLDRCSRIERGDFAYNGSDEESEDGDDGTWEGTRLVVDEAHASGALGFDNGDRMEVS